MGFWRLRTRTAATPDGWYQDLPGLEVLANRLAEGILAGESASIFKGSGMEADGVRPYVAGDDVRAIDWRVTARTGRHHVRDFVEERGWEAHLVLDRSASLHGCASGGPGRAALEVTAALAMAATRAGHRVGLLQLTDRAEGHVPPGSGRHQLKWILASLATLRPTGRGTALGAGLQGLTATLGARALVMVVSDFNVPTVARPETARALAGVARRHELFPVHVRTPGPEDLPPVGPVSLADPESGRRVLVDTSDPAVRASLREAAQERELFWDGVWNGLAVRPVRVDPVEPLGPQLVRGLARRRGGRAA